MSPLLVLAAVALTASAAALLAAFPGLREAVVNALARVGLVRVLPGGGVRWPVSVSPWWIWVVQWNLGPRGWFGVVRNRPGVVRDVPGRLLPHRWGVRLLGLELGDRGGHPRLLVLREGRAEEAVLRLRVAGRRCRARYYPRLGWHVWDEAQTDVVPRFVHADTLEGAVQMFEQAERGSWDCT